MNTEERMIGASRVADITAMRSFTGVAFAKEKCWR